MLRRMNATYGRVLTRAVLAALALSMLPFGTLEAASEPASSQPQAPPPTQDVQLPATGVAPDAPLPTPQELEARGAIIGRIVVQPDEIFDTSIPGERAWLYRTANKLHIRTKPSIVRKQLLFKPGELFRVRIVEETERLLRARNYLYDAKITPIAYDGTTVDLEVRTKDVWTLNPGVSFGRKGGENHAGAAIGATMPALLGFLQDRGFAMVNAMSAAMVVSALVALAAIWSGPETRGKAFD